MTEYQSVTRLRELEEEMTQLDAAVRVDRAREMVALLEPLQAAVDEWAERWGVSPERVAVGGRPLKSWRWDLTLDEEGQRQPA